MPELTDEQIKTLLLAVSNRDKEADTREELSVCQNLITPCDGSSQQAVRDFLHEFELTVKCLNTPTANRLLRRTTKGSLRSEVEKALEAYKDAHRDHVDVDCPWDTMKEHITEAFLSKNEREVTKNKLETIRQGAAEEVQTYSRRFELLVKDAYANPKSKDIQEELIKYYARGLRDDFYAKKIIEEATRRKEDKKDYSLEDVFKKVVQLKSTEEGYQRLGRRSTAPINAVHSDDRDVTALAAQLDRLSYIMEDQKGSKLAAKTAEAILESGFHKRKHPNPKKRFKEQKSDKTDYEPRKPRSGHQQPRWQKEFQSEDKDEKMNSRQKSFQPPPDGGGPRKCWWCKQPGHFQRDCKTFKQYLKQAVNYVGGTEGSYTPAQ